MNSKMSLLYSYVAIARISNYAGSYVCIAGYFKEKFSYMQKSLIAYS